MKKTSQFFKEIQIAYKKRLPFAVYKTPGSDQLKSFICDNREIHYLDDYQKQGFVMAPFDSDKKPVFYDVDRSEFSICQIDKDWNPETGQQTKQGFDPSENKGKQAHLKMVNQAIKKIGQGVADKIVLSRKERVFTSENDPLILFYRLIFRIPQAFTYVWFHPEFGLWAGASPEKLLSENNGYFHTMALAGTQKYIKNAEVHWSQKEKEEQQFVTDQIRKLLDFDSVKFSEPYTKRARNLLHICTDIEGQLPAGSTLESIVSKLHPTAAVCGLPVDVAKQFILEQEGYHRKFYTGYLGEINMPDIQSQESKASSEQNKQSQLYVNLRCMEVETADNHVGVNLFIGGGITAGSDPELEWEETVEKSKVMKSILI